MSFDRQFWDENGYIIIPNAVPAENLQAVVTAMESFTGKDFSKREDWYKAPLLGGGMVNMAHAQPLWDNRQHPRVYEAFRGVWGRDDLWVTINRTNFNPPVGPKWDHGGFIHWDLDPAIRPIEMRVQGVLYLTDTAVDQGGFQCVPGSHRKLQEWHDTHPPDEVPTEEAIMAGLEVKKIEGKAGDLIIWQAALLHGNGKNTSDRPRLAQYICMTPEGTARAPHGLTKGGNELRQAKVDSWRYGPYQRALAEVLGAPEGFVERWLHAMLDEETVGDPPQSGNGARLGANQRSRLIDHLAAAKPWSNEEIAEAKRLTKAYGTTASYLPRALLARNIANIVSDEFGLEFTPRPAELTDLGKRLLGLERW